MIEMTALNLF